MLNSGKDWTEIVQLCEKVIVVNHSLSETRCTLLYVFCHLKKKNAEIHNRSALYHEK